MVDLTEAYALYNEKKYSEAYPIFYDAALFDNDAEAQLYMGMFYYYGDGVEKNIEEAKKWWKKAVRNGSIDAANRMSELSTSTKHTF